MYLVMQTGISISIQLCFTPKHKYCIILQFNDLGPCVCMLNACYQSPIFMESNQRCRLFFFYVEIESGHG